MTSPSSLKKYNLSGGVTMLVLSFACALSQRWGGDALLPLGIALAVALAACVARAPHLGFAALPPLLLAVSYPPAFTDPATLIFMAIAAVWLATELWQARTNMLPRHPSWLLTLALLASLVVATNFSAALHHGIAMNAWLRGLYPFLLFGLAVPFLLRTPPRADWQFFAWAMGLTCLVLSAEILYIYCFNTLWDPIAVTSAIAQKFFNSPVGQHATLLNGALAYDTIKMRITFVMPEAAGILPPLGAVGWFLAAHAVPKRLKWFAIAAAAVCFCAVIASSTRSMLLCSVLSIGLTLLVYYWDSRQRFLESVTIGVAAVTISLPFLAGTGAIDDLSQRNRNLVNNIGSYYAGYISTAKKTRIVSASEASKASQDIGYRVQEYQAAWNAFVDAPLTGQGFGHAIELAFAAGPGKTVHFTATYTHNWIFYWLMVAGIPGLLLYGWLTFAPLVRLRAYRDQANMPLTLVLGGAGIILASYGLFFAVYRTLPNVLVLTMLLAWTLSSFHTAHKPSSRR